MNWTEIIIALVSGVIGYLAKSSISEKNRKGEITAERKIKVAEEAYSKITRLEGKFFQEAPVSIKSAKTEIDEQQEWFFTNRLFMPGDFANKWVQLRSLLWQLDALYSLGTKGIDRASEKESEVEQQIKAAINEIFKEIPAIPMKGELESHAYGSGEKK